jgi:hypothetical protein
MNREPNKTSQAIPVFAILLVLSQVPGAPEFLRWEATAAVRVGYKIVDHVSVLASFPEVGPVFR